MKKESTGRHFAKRSSTFGLHTFALMYGDFFGYPVLCSLPDILLSFLCRNIETLCPISCRTFLFLFFYKAFSYVATWGHCFSCIFPPPYDMESDKHF